MKFTAIFVGLMLMLSTAGCAESSFELAPESRLPVWFTLPAGLSRGDVTVSLTYYTGSPVKFKLWDDHGRILAEVSGRSSLYPYASGQKTPGGGVDEHSYPLYEIVKANGITEVIEHRRQLDRWFYITDDPEIKSKLGV